MILQALSLTLCQNHQASWFPSDSPGSLSLSLSCQSHKTSYTTKSQISHATQLQHNITCSSAVDTYFTLAYHFCQELHRLCPRLPKLPHTMLSTEIFHPSNALWYRASICPRTSQDRCCNSLSKPMRLSFNIMMISKLLRLIRRSSNSGISHSRSTICVCSNLTTPCNFSISIIRPRSCSFSASCTELSLLRSLDLSLASILGKTIAKFLDTQISWAK